MHNTNIGFFDSGVGGIAYLNEIRNVLGTQVHNYHLYYLLDNAYFPYGEKEKDFLITRILTLTQKFIIDKSLDILVLACNTASLLTVNVLREALREKNIDTLIVGVVPAIKPAVELQADKIYVMNTQASSHTEYAKDMANKTKEKYGFESRVFLRGCQELVNAIELMFTHKESSYEAYMIAELDRIVQEIISLHCQAVVLGCTHFLHIKKYLQDLLPREIKIIDSLEGVSNRIMSLIKDRDTAEASMAGKTQPPTNTDKPLLLYTQQDEEKYRVVCQYFQLEFSEKVFFIEND